MLLQDSDLPTEHCGALLGAHNASHFVWNWSDADNPSHASVGTVQQLNQWGSEESPSLLIETFQRTSRCHVDLYFPMSLC